MGLQFALAYGEEIVLKCHISTPRYWLPSCECIVVSLDPLRADAARANFRNMRSLTLRARAHLRLLLSGEIALGQILH
jgi:hypothetical protein